MSKSIKEIIYKKADEQQVYSLDATIEISINLNVLASDISEAIEKSGLSINGLGIQQAFLNFLLHNGAIVTPKVLDYDIEIDGVYKEDEGY